MVTGKTTKQLFKLYSNKICRKPNLLGYPVVTTLSATVRSSARKASVHSLTYTHLKMSKYMHTHLFSNYTKKCFGCIFHWCLSICVVSVASEFFIYLYTLEYCMVVG